MTDLFSVPLFGSSHISIDPRYMMACTTLRSGGVARLHLLLVMIRPSISTYLLDILLQGAPQPGANEHPCIFSARKERSRVNLKPGIQRHRHRPPRPQSDMIFTGSHLVLVSWLGRTLRSLVMKTNATAGTPAEILHTLTGPSTNRRPAKTTPRQIWTGRQIRGRRDPSSSRAIDRCIHGVLPPSMHEGKPIAVLDRWTPPHRLGEPSCLLPTGTPQEPPQEMLQIRPP